MKYLFIDYHVVAIIMAFAGLGLPYVLWYFGYRRKKNTSPNLIPKEERKSLERDLNLLRSKQPVGELRLSGDDMEEAAKAIDAAADRVRKLIILHGALAVGLTENELRELWRNQNEKVVFFYNANSSAEEVPAAS